MNTNLRGDFHGHSLPPPEPRRAPWREQPSGGSCVRVLTWIFTVVVLVGFVAILAFRAGEGAAMAPVPAYQAGGEGGLPDIFGPGGGSPGGAGSGVAGAGAGADPAQEAERQKAEVAKVKLEIEQEKQKFIMEFEEEAKNAEAEKEKFIKEIEEEEAKATAAPSGGVDFDYGGAAKGGPSPGLFGAGETEDEDGEEYSWSYDGSYSTFSVDAGSFSYYDDLSFSYADLSFSYGMESYSVSYLYDGSMSFSGGDGVGRRRRGRRGRRKLLPHRTGGRLVRGGWAGGGGRG